MTIQEAIENIKKLREYIECASFIDTAKIIETYDMAIRSLEAWEELKMGVHKLHPIKRGDNEYANGVYDGECYIINYVTDFINKHLSEVEGEG